MVTVAAAELFDFLTQLKNVTQEFVFSQMRVNASAQDGAQRRVQSVNGPGVDV